jgi:hypothetical protein
MASLYNSIFLFDQMKSLFQFASFGSFSNAARRKIDTGNHTAGNTAGNTGNHTADNTGNDTGDQARLKINTADHTGNHTADHTADYTSIASYIKQYKQYKHLNNKRERTKNSLTQNLENENLNFEKQPCLFQDKLTTPKKAKRKKVAPKKEKENKFNPRSHSNRQFLCKVLYFNTSLLIHIK